MELYTVTFLSCGVASVNMVEASSPDDANEMFMEKAGADEVLEIRPARAEDIRPGIPLLSRKMDGEIFYSFPSEKALRAMLYWASL